MTDRPPIPWSTRPPTVGPFGRSALLLAPVFFGPNLVLAAFGAVPALALTVLAVDALALAGTAVAFVVRGRRDPAARWNWPVFGLASLTTGTVVLVQLLAAAARLNLPNLRVTIGFVVPLALGIGGLALAALPVRATSIRKGLTLAADSLIFAVSILFIVFTIAFSRHVRQTFALPQFSNEALLASALAVFDGAILLYLARVAPASRRQPLVLIAVGFLLKVVPWLYIAGVVGSSGTAGPPVAVFFCYSAGNFAFWQAALCPIALRPPRRAARRQRRVQVALACLAYTPCVVSVVLGFVVLSGNRALSWSGFGCFFLILIRLGMALLDSHGHSHTLRERVRERSEMLAESQARLARAERLDALGRLAGGVAHDFNNLLTAVVGNAELLGQSLSTDDRRQAYVREITRTCKRVEALTRQLLTFARRQPRTLQVFCPADLVAEMRGLLVRSVRENVRLSIECAAGTGNVKMDPYQLEQVVMNLAVNARDAMPDGGTLSIEVANKHLDAEHQLRHVNARSGPHVCVRVRDTGRGIPQEFIDRIFDPFFTTKENGRGTGLGLAICYGIVKEADGHVVVSSTVGVGTTFDVYLPVTAEPPTPSSVPPPQPAAARPTARGTILLAEDEPAVRRLMVEVLHTAGYVTLEAENGREAIRLAGSHNGPIELFLTDLVMPEVGGLAAAKEVLGLHPETRVLVMSGYTADENASEVLEASETPFILKPVTPSALLNRVREVITTGPAASYQ